MRAIGFLINSDVTSQIIFSPRLGLGQKPQGNSFLGVPGGNAHLRLGVESCCSRSSFFIGLEHEPDLEISISVAIRDGPGILIAWIINLWDSADLLYAF